ncbi:unnamed protein product [Caenorhabditis brenneri]
MVIRTRFQARPHCYLDECTQGPRPRSQCLNIIRHTPQYANSTDGHAARLARNHYHSPNNVYTHRCCCNTQRRTGRLAQHMSNIASGRSYRAIAVRATYVKHCERRAIYLLSGHRYQPVLVIYGEDKPVFVSKIEHMVFIVTTLYHILQYPNLHCIRGFLQYSDAAAKVGLTGTRKRSSAPAVLDLRSLFIASLFGGYPGEDQKHGATPESQEELPSTPKSRRRALPKTEVPESRCTTPQPQFMRELPAPGAPQRLARRRPARSFTPPNENIEGPRAPSRPKRPDESLPFRVLNPGY